METTLHRQLKELYCGDPAGREVRVAGYRVDAVVNGVLVEIQHSSLLALRSKISRLLESHDVLIVKPLAARKQIVRRESVRAKAARTRASPRHETLFHLFVDLVHFVGVFPHPRLTLDVLLTEQEETRVARCRRWFRARDYRVTGLRLTGVVSRHTFRTAGDLVALLPNGLGAEFTTAEIARLAEIPRWLAQKMAYCLRKAGALATVGKQRNALVYRRSPAGRAAA
jgi:hypothetical protein